VYILLKYLRVYNKNLKKANHDKLYIWFLIFYLVNDTEILGVEICSKFNFYRNSLPGGKATPFDTGGNPAKCFALCDISYYIK